MMGDDILEATQRDADYPKHLASMTEVAEEPVKLSRRLKRYLDRKAHRKDMRKALKERCKKRAQMRAQQKLINLQSDELASDKVTNLSRKALSHMPRMCESPCQTKVVLDCAYDHMMSFKDICKLAHQVCQCYSFNRRAKIPIQLYITGLSMSEPDPNVPVNHTRLHDRLKLNDCQNWDVNFSQEDYTTLFPASSIVYLCAESDHILPHTFHSPMKNENNNSFCTDDTIAIDNCNSKANVSGLFTTDDVYVIGGLVDHNKYTSYCYKQALTRKHRTAKLPLAESGLSIIGRYVLSTLHVFQALCPVLTGSTSWSESLKLAIPTRKIKPV